MSESTMYCPKCQVPTHYSCWGQGGYVNGEFQAKVYFRCWNCSHQFTGEESALAQFDAFMKTLEKAKPDE